MSRDPSYVLDLVDAFQRATSFLQGMDQESFGQDEKTQSAVLHQILVAGEAVKRLSAKFRAEHTDIPWKKIAGMRDRVIHNYDDVDLDLVWDTVTLEVAALLPKLQALLPNP